MERWTPLFVICFLGIFLFSTTLVTAQERSEVPIEGDNLDDGNEEILISPAIEKVNIIPSSPLINRAGWHIDNIKEFAKTNDMPYGQVKIKNSFFWILPQDTIEKITLNKNTDTCGRYCYAEKEITIYTNTTLIDSVKFLKLMDDGSWKESNIRNYQFFIKNDTSNWISYKYEVMPAGTYQVRLEGEKRQDWTYDWIITSQGVEITDWYLWAGNSSFQLVDDYEFGRVTAVSFINTTNTSTVIGWAGPPYGEIHYNMSKLSSMYALGENMTVIDNVTAVTHGENGFQCIWNVLYGYKNGTGVLVAGSALGSPSYGREYWLNPYPTIDLINITFYAGGTASDTCSIKNISFYVQSENKVLLNTPVDNYISPTNNVHFNCSSSTYGGATITNLSLWTNTSGTWIINQTSYSSLVIYNHTRVGAPDWTSNDGSYTVPQIVINTSGFYKNVSLYDSSVDVINSSFHSTAQFFYKNGTIVNTTEIDGANPSHVNPYNNTEVSKVAIWIRCDFSRNCIGSTDIAYGTTPTIQNSIFDLYLTTPTSWTCQACDSDGVCGFSLLNRSLSIDTSTPNITILSPTGKINYGYIGQNITLNYSITDVNAQSCWFTYNYTNQSLNCSDNSTFIVVKQYNNQQNLTIYANDSVGNQQALFVNWSYKIFENSRNYNQTTFTSANENYLTNISSDGTQTIIARLWYSTSGMLSTNKAGDNNNARFTNQQSMASTNVGTNTFFWEYLYGSESINSTNLGIQNSSEMQFGLCNATNNKPYVNYTFKDESTLLNINASAQSMIWAYWIDDSGNSKTLNYQNVTENNNYAFCFSPANSPMTYDLTFQYASTDSGTVYPTRTYSITDGSLTNSTTNKTLYLLGSGDGISVTFIVSDEDRNALSGVDVKAERVFSGVTETVSQGITDDSGGVTFFLNPNYAHTISYTDGSCSKVVSITPSSTTYSLTLDCRTSEYYMYHLNGIRFQKYPGEGVIEKAGVKTFAYNVQAYDFNNTIIAAKFEIYDTFNHSKIYGSNSSNITTGICTPWNCTLTTRINLIDGMDIKGRYYVWTNMTNGYVKLEGDARWILIAGNASSINTIKNVLTDIRDVFSGWNEEGLVGADEIKKSEFSRIIFFFMSGAIILAVFSRYTGYDAQNPGAFMMLIALMLVLGTMVGPLPHCEPSTTTSAQDMVECGGTGMATDYGLFYYSGLTKFAFVNNWILAFTAIMMAFGMMASTWRRT